MIRSMRVSILIVLAVVALAMPTAAQNQTPEAARDEYVPIEQLPPEAELPAAPMVIAAYSFVWVALLLYMLSIVRRIGRVERDLQTLERGSGGAPPVGRR